MPKSGFTASTPSDSVISFTAPKTPTDTRMLVSPQRERNLERTIGLDLFVDSDLTPFKLAKVLLPLVPPNLKLIMLSNRGTQVWPTGSLFTECVNHYRCRVESLEAEAVSEAKLLQLASVISEKVRVCSLEMLMMKGDQRLYSLAQGQ